MAYAEAITLINKPIDEVFKFVLDGNNNKLWRPNIMDIQNASGGPAGVGSIFVQGMQGPNGIRIEADYEIIECEDNKRIMFKVLKGPYSAIGSFSFESEENGVKVTFSMNETSSSSDNGEITRHLQRVVSSIEGLKKYMDKSE